MNPYLIVFCGCGLGGMLRYAANMGVPRLLGSNFPYHTLLVNIVGSFAMGSLLATSPSKASPSQEWRLFLTTGILGGFTTFSAFSWIQWRSTNGVSWHSASFMCWRPLASRWARLLLAFR